jgi:hypothetical protein
VSLAANEDEAILKVHMNINIFINIIVANTFGFDIVYEIFNPSDA